MQTPLAEPGSRRPHQWIGLASGIAAAGFLILISPPSGLSNEGMMTAAVAVLMAIWWITEAIPIPATAVLPLVLFPVLGVSTIQSAAAPYANPLIFLFLGGFLIAIAMQRWNLHRRLALRIIHRVGVRPHAIIAGFALSAAFLSMWVSNTATAMMMLPIGLSVIELVRRGDSSAGSHFATNLMLVIAYASSIGGLATLIGTPPNAFLAGFMLETYGTTIGFLEWMQVGLPLVVISLPLMVILLTRFIYPIRLREVPGGRAFIESELAKLGPMQRPEKMIGGVFAATAMLWITRPLLENIIPGLSDPGIAMTMALLLFIVPADAKRGSFLLEWKDAEGLPWGVLILFGGGLSLAAAVDGTGLAAWIGGQTSGLSEWPLPLVVAAVCGTILLLTELTSNTATAAAFLPIVASVAVGLGHDAMLLAAPAALAASCAFMMPVATPPNAIVYGSNYVTIPQMARAGIVLNVLFLVLITAATFLLVPLLY